MARGGFRVLPLLPERLLAVRRPRIWQEVSFIGVAYLLYSLVRNGVLTREELAFANAARIMRLEETLSVNIERGINAAVAGVQWLSLLADYWYATMHFAVTLGVLVWLWRRHPLRYRAARSVLMAMNLIALAGFWLFPLAPPRMMPGFVDTLVRDHIWGSYASAGVAAASNQFAAMPSMHVGWSLWCAIVVATLAGRAWLRTAAAVYPLITILVIVGTANHYLFDAVGGAVALVSGFGVQRLLSGRAALTAPIPLPLPLPLPRPVSVERAA